MSRRRVLLLEPNYKNKYPPMGLMKLAMYHRIQGDEVVFYKGDLSAFILSEWTRDALVKFQELDEECPVREKFNWFKLAPAIKEAIHTGTILPNSELEGALTRQPLARLWLADYRKQYRSGAYCKNPRWDRVCVTTLFTFHWKLTIETIEFAKKVCKDINQVLVGGILASVVPDKVEAKTGIKPYVGCLKISKLPGDDTLPTPFGKTLIDTLPLDYSILDEIDYRYPATDAYYAYATRGCINKCAFCAVPQIEPEYRDYIPLKKRVKSTIERFGEQRHLLLLDNNVFVSKKFDKIIDEIRDSGFAKGATFVPPNQLAVAVNLLQNGWNDRAYIRLAVRLLNTFVEKLDGECHDRFYGILLNHGLLHDYTATKDGVLAVYEQIKDEYEKARSRKPVARFIDFNQGMDARLATPENMAKLATVAIRPFRIAFDSWGERKHYVRAVKLAKDNSIAQMSNYLLYNFRDKPVDLYRRLLLNIDLCTALSVNIYSFPMKYHPIMEEEWFSNRDYIGPHWTRKAIRTVQAVLNSTLGKIGRGRTFFFKAFGRDEAEFAELIRMPEAFIIKRWDAELGGLTDKWRKAYTALQDADRAFVDSIVDTNAIEESMGQGRSASVRKVLAFYMIERESIPLADKDAKARHIQKFEKTCPAEISEECRRLLSEVTS
jgi:IS1 family transposase